MAEQSHAAEQDAHHSKNDVPTRKHGIEPSPAKGSHEKLRERITLFDTIVTITVGPAKRAYSLHKGFLCAYSGYFRAAFIGKFHESTTLTVHLEEEDPAVFDVFVTWLYTQRLLPGDMSPRDIDWHLLAKLYVFADRHRSPRFANAVTDILATKALGGETPPCSTIEWIWENTGPEAMLRRLIVDCFASLTDLDLYFKRKNHRGILPVDFVCEVLRRCYQLRKGVRHPGIEFETALAGKTYYVELDEFAIAAL